MKHTKYPTQEELELRTKLTAAEAKIARLKSETESHRVRGLMTKLAERDAEIVRLNELLTEEIAKIPKGAAYYTAIHERDDMLARLEKALEFYVEWKDRSNANQTKSDKIGGHVLFSLVQHDVDVALRHALTDLAEWKAGDV